jgi:hypothetical protein
VPIPTTPYTEQYSVQVAPTSWTSLVRCSEFAAGYVLIIARRRPILRPPSQSNWIPGCSSFRSRGPSALFMAVIDRSLSAAFTACDRLHSSFNNYRPTRQRTNCRARTHARTTRTNPCRSPTASSVRLGFHSPRIRTSPGLQQPGRGVANALAKGANSLLQAALSHFWDLRTDVRGISGLFWDRYGRSG